MKTNQIYFADASLTIDKEYKDTYSFKFCGIHLYDFTIFYKPLKKVLVLYKENEYGKCIAIDLNTKEKYPCEVPCDVGKVFVTPQSLEAFNKVTGNEKANLSKRKIKKLGNKKLY